MSKPAVQSSLPSVKLGEVAQSIVDGPFGSSLKTSDYVDSGVPVLQGKNITGNRFVWKEIRYISEKKAQQLKRSSTVVGDHLLIKIGSIGYSAILDDLDGHDFAIIPANLVRIRPDRSVVDDQYLHRVLTSDEVVRHLKNIASKTAQPALSLKKIKATTIPLPSLPEQRRIAAVLDKADALRAQRRESIAQLDVLLRATFLEMFGDPITNPMGWDLRRIEEFCRTGSGGTPSRKELDRYYTGGTIPWVKSGELREGVITDTEEHVTEVALRETSIRIVPAGTILLAMYGATVGRMGLLGMDATTNQAVCHVLPDSNVANTTYLFHALSAMVPEMIRAGVGGAQPNISQHVIKGLTLRVPPLNVQSRFADVVQAIDRQKAAQCAHLTELGNLFDSLQSRAFKGEL